MNVKVIRDETNVTDTKMTYVYQTEVSGEKPLSGQECELTFNGEYFNGGPCGNMDSWVGRWLEQSGDYAIVTDAGQVVASFTFTLPTAQPKPLAKSSCKITSAKQVGPTTSKGTPLKVVTNGKCTKGSWSYAYVMADNKRVGVGSAPYGPGADGRWLVKGLKPSWKNLRVTVFYHPKSRAAATTSPEFTVNKG